MFTYQSKFTVKPFKAFTIKEWGTQKPSWLLTNQLLNDTINHHISAEKIYAAVFEDDSFTKVAPTDMVVGDTVHMAIVNKMETAAFVKPTKCWLSSSTDPTDNTNKEVVINNGCAKNVSPSLT